MAARSRVVVGAGPVGLCLALALAQQDVAVTLIEAMSDDNFLDQVPRAGSNHPTTLEFFDRIGLYDKLEPRGIDRAQIPLLGPAGQRADRRVRPRAAEGRHQVSLRAAVRAHQDHRGGAEDGEGASADRGAHGDRRSRASSRPPTRVLAHVTNAGGESRDHPRQLSRQREGARSIVAQGSRRRVRGLHLSGAHASTSRSPTTSASTATPSATTSPIRSNTPTCSTGKARRTAGASISRPRSTTTRTR